MVLRAVYLLNSRTTGWNMTPMVVVCCEYHEKVAFFLIFCCEITLCMADWVSDKAVGTRYDT